MPSSKRSALEPNTNGVRSFSIHALETRCRLQFRCADSDTSLKYVAAAAGWLGSFEAKISRSKPDSTLSLINAEAGRDWVMIDREMEQLLEVADMTHRLTQGLLDPAGLPLLKIWEEQKAHQPSEDEIRKALDLSNWKELQREPGKVFLPREGMGLDFGELGRMYAVDMLVRLARQHGIQDAFVNLGQHYFAIGGDGAHTGWELCLEDGIQLPSGSNGLLLSNSAASCAIVDQAQTLDRRTGRPVKNGLRAATVLAPSCLTAGIHASCMLILGQNEGLRFAESTAGVEACLLSPEGKAVTTRGFHKQQSLSKNPLAHSSRADRVLHTAGSVQPRPVVKWISRDLIRLWPWLLPVVLLLVSLSHGFGGGITALVPALSAWGTVWMTFFIARRLWGQYRAHAAATMLMVTLGTFSFGWLPMPDTVSCFLTLAAIAALVRQQAFAFFIALGLGLLMNGPTALLVPLSAAVGWWLAGGLRPTVSWLRDLVLTLGISLSLLWLAMTWQPEWLPQGMLGQSVMNEDPRPWWHFVPVLFLALMPWSFCTPRVLRQAWCRLRTRRLCTRHGLLLGWMLPPLVLLMSETSSLPTVTLPLVSALVIAFCPPMINVRRLWKIGGLAVATWLTLSLSGVSFQSPPTQQVVKPSPNSGTIREHDSQWTRNHLTHVSFSPPTPKP